MTTLDQRLTDELKVAMRTGDNVRRDVIRFLRAGLKNAQIARGQPLSETEELAILQQQIKQRQDAIEQFAAGGRADLVERETGQLAVLRSYLPAALTPDELDQLVRGVIAETGATGPRDMGRVMPVLSTRAAGRADNRTLSEAARRQLTAG